MFTVCHGTTLYFKAEPNSDISSVFPHFHMLLDIERPPFGSRAMSDLPTLSKEQWSLQYMALHSLFTNLLSARSPPAPPCDSYHVSALLLFPLRGFFKINKCGCMALALALITHNHCVQVTIELDEKCETSVSDLKGQN